MKLDRQKNAWRHQAERLFDNQIQPDGKQQIEALRILKLVNDALQKDFSDNRTQSYNPNVKGGEYEVILRKFLEPYLSPAFDFYTRAKIIDYTLEFVDLLSAGRNEWDVVATFKTAVPSVILTGTFAKTIPLDSVAFIAEVAQDVNNGQLTDDLDHFKQLGDLPLTPTTAVTTNGFPLYRPLKILVYDACKMDKSAMIQTLERRKSDFDLLLIVSDDELYVSPELPISKAFSSEKKITPFSPFGTLFTIIALLSCVRLASFVSTISTFMNLYYAAAGYPMHVSFNTV